MNIDIENLMNNTAEAIKKGKEEAARSKQEKAAIKAAEDAATVSEAKIIIDTIPSQCQTAAAEGKSRAC